MLTVEDYLRLPYHIELVYAESPEDDDAGWVATIRELQGCIAQGRSPDELMANIRLAMEIWIEDQIEEGHDIPLPDEEPEHSGRFIVRLPPALHSALVREAKRQGVSLNQLATAILAGGIAWQGPATREAAGSHQPATP